MAFHSQRLAIPTIQAVVRGFLLRQKQQRQQSAARMLQSQWRSRRCAMAFQHQKGATRVIQLAWQRHHVKEARQLQQVKASRKLQSVVRGFLLRRAVVFERKAAVRVQALWRSRLCAVQFCKQQTAVRTIGATWRRFSMCRSYKTAIAAATLLQSNCRRTLAIRSFQQTKLAGLILQNWAKRILQERVNERLRQWAAVTLQAWSRQRMAIQKWRVIKNGTVSLQTAFRSRTCRTRYLQLQQSTQKAQSLVRAFLASKIIKALRAERKQLLQQWQQQQDHEAAVIQSWWRMVSAMSVLHKKEKAVVALQSCVRGFLVRRQQQQPLLQQQTPKFAGALGAVARLELGSPTSSIPEIPCVDGWPEDDDIDLAMDKAELEEDGKVEPVEQDNSTLTFQNTESAAVTREVEFSDAVADGWSDEEMEDEEENEIAVPQSTESSTDQAHEVPQPESVDGDGWADAVEYGWADAVEDGWDEEDQDIDNLLLDDNQIEGVVETGCIPTSRTVVASQADAVVCIQRCCRGHLVRQQMERQHQAALSICHCYMLWKTRLLLLKFQCGSVLLARGMQGPLSSSSCRTFALQQVNECFRSKFRFAMIQERCGMASDVVSQIGLVWGLGTSQAEETSARLLQATARSFLMSCRKLREQQEQQQEQEQVEKDEHPPPSTPTSVETVPEEQERHAAAAEQEPATEQEQPAPSPEPVQAVPSVEETQSEPVVNENESFYSSIARRLGVRFSQDEDDDDDDEEEENSRTNENKDAEHDDDGANDTRLNASSTNRSVMLESGVPSVAIATPEPPTANTIPPKQHASKDTAVSPCSPTFSSPIGPAPDSSFCSDAPTPFYSPQQEEHDDITRSEQKVSEHHVSFEDGDDGDAQFREGVELLQDFFDRAKVRQRQRNQQQQERQQQVTDWFLNRLEAKSEHAVHNLLLWQDRDVSSCLERLVERARFARAQVGTVDDTGVSTANRSIVLGVEGVVSPIKKAG